MGYPSQRKLLILHLRTCGWIYCTTSCSQITWHTPSGGGRPPAGSGRSPTGRREVPAGGEIYRGAAREVLLTRRHMLLTRQALLWSACADSG